jgi:hypothetical protein
MALVLGLLHHFNLVRVFLLLGRGTIIDSAKAPLMWLGDHQSTIMQDKEARSG